MACEEHLHITVGFSLKNNSEWSLLCRFEQPTLIEAITIGFKTKTDSEGPCRHLLVKKYKKNIVGLEPAIAAFCKKYKKFGLPDIRARVTGLRVRGLNR